MHCYFLPFCLVTMIKDCTFASYHQFQPGFKEKEKCDGMICVKMMVYIFARGNILPALLLKDVQIGDQTN
ncbi:hypothetical protein QVD17_06090 [Tagetes erecta]|uniref:Uncharacterized protein n=1 Tax=Tagetes erecta TaxID=13708 RepID=A0AAD8P625_TARER|nr:hypothetical protein QVD17_06090 [Tagetes erecta]